MSRSPSERPLRTAEVARAAGVHPNTVRLYEEWGYLSPVPRTPTGYRQFSQMHVEQMRLARLALQWPYPGGKALVLDLVRSAAAGDLGTALELAYQYLAHARAERAHAEAAVEFLERWAQGHATDPSVPPLRIQEAARRLSVTPDMLRNWDRNGLLDVPRDPKSGYRMYGAAELGRVRVIRMLRQAGYSLNAILRMLLAFDAGDRANLRRALDTPRADEDVYSVADRWLSTLSEQEQRALDIIQQLAHMLAMEQERTKRRRPPRR
ncbi:MAG TPA: MerR family transcriptional regulator [Armatimonadota bacterium]|jgi:DNA-binding transcriptional MerR regulator|nr:MerR family transcriptional regulator [Armatimonadota bacterium]